MGQLVPFARSADAVKVNQRIQTLVDYVKTLQAN